MLDLQFLQQSLKNSILSGVEAVAKSNAEAIARFLEDSLNDALVAALALPTAALEEKTEAGPGKTPAATREGLSEI